MMHVKCLAEYRFAVKAQSMSAVALAGGESHWLAKISQPAPWPWRGLGSSADGSLVLIFSRTGERSRGGGMRSLLGSPGQWWPQLHRPTGLS